MPVMNMLPGGSTLQIPLEACTAFSASAGNAKVELTWTDPKDKYATPEGDISDTGDQLVSEWDHTVLVRKTGSQPAGPNDGTVVVSSSVRNQYQTTAYVDSGLTNDTTYYYGVFAYNKDGVASSGAFVSATPQAGTPIGNLNVGDIVKTTLNGAPTEFLIVHKGRPSSLYDQSCDGIWVLNLNIYTQSIMGRTDPYSYASTSISAWLNSSYLSMFNSWLSDAILSVKIPYTGANADNNNMMVYRGANGLQCKIFLLGAAEIGLEMSNIDEIKDGSKLSYFLSGDTSTARGKRIATYNGVAAEWATRTLIDRSISLNNPRYFCATAIGSTNKIDPVTSSGIRPTMILPTTILVDSEMNLIES